MKLKEYRNQLEKSKEYTKAKEDLKLHFALADAVLEARMRKGWTQKELAKAMGTKQANISRIESGLANPTLEFISRLTTVLDFDIAFVGENEAVVLFDYDHEELFLREFDKKGFVER
jgi:transcriptional regulator with XRE-family HTH domain